MSLRLCSNLLVVLALILFSARADAVVLSQEEVDHIVDTDLLMYEHDKDFQAAEKSLTARGVTKPMLAHGYYSAMVKTMNAATGSLGAGKFQSAAYGFRCTATDIQVTNLLYIAEVSTNALSAAGAIEVYHARAPFSLDLINWCTNRISKGNCSDCLKSTIWSCFGQTMSMKDVPVDVKNAVLGCSRLSLYTDPQSVFVADKLLSQCDPGYKTSQLRRRALARIRAMGAAEMTDSARQYFGALLRELERK